MFGRKKCKDHGDLVLLKNGIIYCAFCHKKMDLKDLKKKKK